MPLIPLDNRAVSRWDSAVQDGTVSLQKPLYRVLVVDDDFVSRTVLVLMLKKAGAREVIEAENGYQALEIAATRCVDAVFLDWMMPGLDGLETAWRLRASGLNCPIIAVTANAMSGDREACLEAGMDAYLSKPILLEGLQALLTQFFKINPLC